METDTAIERIELLKENANSIKDLFLHKIPKWRNDIKFYDKRGWGFNDDDRFNACKPFLISFSSHVGTYGDSGCSRQCDLDEYIFKKHLLKYLNDNVEAIMLKIAEQIQEEAKTFKDKAEKELNQKMKMLENL